MMLTPRQLTDKQFTSTRVRAGYDQGEVDDFLDRVSEDYEFLYAIHQGLKKKHREPETAKLTKVVAPPEPSEMIAKVLRVAEETAEKHIEEAKAEAGFIIAQARGEAEVLIGNTQMDASAILAKANENRQVLMSEAENEKNRIIGELETKRAQLQTKVDDLVGVETEVTARLRNALERWNQ